MTPNTVATDSEFVQRCCERNAVSHLRNEQWQEIQQQQNRFGAEVTPRQNVGGRESDRERDEHDRQRDKQRDEQHLPQLEIRPGIGEPVGCEGGRQRLAEPALGERAHHDVADDAGKVENEPQQEDVDDELPGAATHWLPLPLADAHCRRNRHAATDQYDDNERR